MKKMTKKVISLILISALALGVFAVSASAEESKYIEFDSMFTIGDSNAMGFGLRGYQGREDPFNYDHDYEIDIYKNGTPGSFPNLVAEELGIVRKNHTAMAYPAQRSIDALYFLGGISLAEMDDYFCNVSINDKSAGWLRQTIIDSGGTVTEDSTEHTLGTHFADTVRQNGEDGNQLVVMYSGAADIFHYMVMHMQEVADGVSADNILPLVEKAIKVLWDGYYNFVTYTPKLIERVKELDPDCTLVVLGTFNPMKDVKISEDAVLPLLEVLGVITNMQNSYYKKWAEEYDAIYVDIPNVETATLENNLTLNTIFGKTEGFDAESIYHGTQEGYAYIARQILEQLTVEKQLITTNIVVDLGSAKSVASVTVNSKKVTNFMYDPATHKLTVPYYTPFAKTMIITEQLDDGEEFMGVYTLKWTENGYYAKRIFATMSIMKTLGNLITKVVGIIRAVMDAVKNLVPVNNIIPE